MGIRQRKEVPGQPWVYDYKDPATGKRKLATPKSGLKRDALALKKKIDAEIESGLHVPFSDSPTVATVAEIYLKDNEQRRKDGRISFNYEFAQRKIVQKHLLPAMGHRKMAEIKVEHVIKLYEAMISDGHLPSNARENIRRMSRLERFAARRGYTKRDVFKSAMAELSGVARKPIKTFALDDVRLLLTVSSQPWKNRTPQSHRNQAMMHLAVNLAAFCGLRFGELFGLTLDAVNLDGNTLHIRRGLHRVSDSGRVVLAPGLKTPAARRDVPIPRHIRGLLAAWIRDHYFANPDRLLFTTDARSRTGKKGMKAGENAGQPISSDLFHSHWRGLLCAAGLRERDKSAGLHFHALRHFASALMVEHHIPLTDVAGLMGHKSYDLTLQVYAHSIVGGAKRHTAFENMAETVNATKTQLLPVTH